MTDPTCWPRSAAVRRRGTSPFTTCTRSMWCAVAMTSRSARSNGSVPWIAVTLSARGDDGADGLAGECAGQIAGDEAVHNLHLADVPCRFQQIENRELEDRIV